MQFIDTKFPNVYIVEPEKKNDSRGFFSRMFCAKEFEHKNLPSSWPQSSLSHNLHKGTFRGFHYQKPPSKEAKFIRCITGEICSFIVDIQVHSSYFKQHITVKLQADDHLGIFIPHGYAFGFQTLQDKCEILYMMSDFYQPELDDGYNCSDAALNISLPLPISNISERDTLLPLLSNVSL